MQHSEQINELAAALAKAQGSGDRWSEAKLIRAMLPKPPMAHRSRGASPIEFFMEKIGFGMSECWYWRGLVDPGGYGLVSRKMYGETRAHRSSWMLFHGPIQNGLKVLHKCDVRSCVNPDHLFLGTQQDNIADMMAKGRQQRGPGLHGEANPMSRLTAEQVESIRAEYAAGGTSMHRLARKHGVSSMTVCRAINRQSWNH